MKKKSIILFLLVLGGYISFAQDDFNRIEKNIIGQLASRTDGKSLTRTVNSNLSSLKSDGSWSDIPYDNMEIAKWQGGQHLDRIRGFALSLQMSPCKAARKKILHNAIIKALTFWYQKDPKSKNWWHNEIASPQKLGEIMILMKQSGRDLPDELKTSLLKRMERGDMYSKTGANKLDIAIHNLYRACISRDDILMDSAVSHAFYPVRFTTLEGLQYDYSYLQHGPQLQIASYGLVFLTGTYNVASWLIGTTWELPSEKVALLDHYLTHTYLSSVRGRYSDFNIHGRGISRPDIMDEKNIAERKGNSSLLDLAKKLRPESASLIQAAKQRITELAPPSWKVTPAHNHYWRADYTQHQRPEFSFNVRMASDRTKRTEAGNRENLLGKFLPDGSTNMQRSGKEYYNIMPLWEWDKIPGITSRDFKQDQPIRVQWGEMGSTAFVGGVSDGLYGASAYDMDYNQVKAKKAWFFFDREVVSLGAGIESNTAENVVTAINQCWLNGPVMIYEGGKYTEVKDHKESQGINWVWHDSIAYIFPDNGNLRISTKYRKGNWKEINAGYPKDSISGRVFNMWLEHGINMEHGAYSYITLPSIGFEEMNPSVVNDVVILKNTSSVQAIEHLGLNMIQAVFYKPGKVQGGKFILEADEPCILMMKEGKEGISVSIADPAQKLTRMTLTLKLISQGLEKKLECVLPQGHMAGSSVHFEVNWK